MDCYKLLRIGILKTLWINFRILPFRQAARLPIILARNVRIGKIYRGCIEIPDEGRMQVGFHGYAASCFNKSLLFLEGRLILKGKGSHVFGPGLIMRIARGGVLQIGDNFSCHKDNTFIVNKAVVVGNDNMWSFDILVMDTDAHVIYDKEGTLLNPNKEVLFGDRVWVGSRNTILKGASIPDGCILGSGGVVTRRLENPQSVYCSNNLIRAEVIWQRTRNLEPII